MGPSPPSADGPAPASSPAGRTPGIRSSMADSSPGPAPSKSDWLAPGAIEGALDARAAPVRSSRLRVRAGRRPYRARRRQVFGPRPRRYLRIGRERVKVDIVIDAGVRRHRDPDALREGQGHVAEEAPARDRGVAHERRGERRSVSAEELRQGHLDPRGGLVIEVDMDLVGRREAREPDPVDAAWTASVQDDPVPGAVDSIGVAVVGVSAAAVVARSVPRVLVELEEGEAVDIREGSSADRGRQIGQDPAVEVGARQRRGQALGEVRGRPPIVGPGRRIPRALLGATTVVRRRPAARGCREGEHRDDHPWGPGCHRTVAMAAWPRRLHRGLDRRPRHLAGPVVMRLRQSRAHPRRTLAAQDLRESAFQGASASGSAASGSAPPGEHRA